MGVRFHSETQRSENCNSNRSVWLSTRMLGLKTWSQDLGANLQRSQSRSWSRVERERPRSRPDHRQRPKTSLFAHYKCTASVESTINCDLNNSQRVLQQYLEAISDNDSAEGAERGMGEDTAMLRYGFCFYWFCVFQRPCLIVRPNPARISKSPLKALCS